MKKQQGFIEFIKSQYQRSMSSFSNKKPWHSTRIALTKKGRAPSIIFSYILIVVSLFLIFIPWKEKGPQVIAIVTLLGHAIITLYRTEFSFVYFLFLYLKYYKKIDNDKYSINEQVICRNFLFKKAPENFWAVVNKYYKVLPLFCNTKSFVSYSLVIREKGRKDRNVIKTLRITPKAIYLDEKKIFDNLYNITALDDFLKKESNRSQNK